MSPLGIRLPLLSSQILRRGFTSITPSQSQQKGEIVVPNIAASFPYRWLRDSCQCGACIHPSTRQKLHKTSDIPYDVLPRVTTVAGEELRVTWETRHHTNGTSLHNSVYTFDWLKTYANEENRRSFHRDIDRIIWTPEKLRDASHLFVDYSELQTKNSAILLAAVTQLLQYGILFVKGVPTDLKDDVGCELRQLAAKFGKIRNTFYGEVWDVMNIKNSTNIAYTNLDLGLHMDLLYFQHTPRYQILHSLRNRVQGGTSIFVDGIHTAQRLYSAAPSAFHLLSRTPVTYHYINDGHHFHHAHPTISLSPSSSNKNGMRTPPHIDYINYSPPFQAPLPIDTPDEFYDALKVFADLLEEDRYEYTLKEGEAVIFDNRRVLHARTEFHETSTTPEGETSRWLKGCYFEEDDVLDLRRTLSKREVA